MSLHFPLTSPKKLQIQERRKTAFTKMMRKKKNHFPSLDISSIAVRENLQSFMGSKRELVESIEERKKNPE